MRSALVLSALMLSALAARADDDQLLVQFGRLLDANDQPVNGTKDLTFVLYPTATAGAVDVVWQETYSVPIAAGTYGVTLGSDTKDGKKPLTRANVSGERWLAVRIDGTELAPRLRIAAVPHALVADDAASLGGHVAADYLLRADADTRYAGKAAPVVVGGGLGGTGVTGDSLVVKFGRDAGTAAEGNDPRLSDPRPPTGTATGDLAGTYPGPQVTALRGRALSADAPTNGQFLRYDDASSSWRAATVPPPDLTGIVRLDSNGKLPALDASQVTGVVHLDANGKLPAMDGSQLTGVQSQAVVTLVDAATIAVDASKGNVFDVTLGGNHTLANATNLRDGALYTFRIRQDSTGVRTLAFGTGYVFIGPTPSVASSAGTVNVLGFVADAATLRHVFSHLALPPCTAGSTTFAYNGQLQTFVAPPGCPTITAKAWGAGGASGGYDNDDKGGGGGFTQATFAVSPGETLTVLVSGGGTCASLAAGGFGGGGNSGSTPSGCGGSGGGRSAIQRAGNDVLTAGGGGGGTQTSGSRFGGAGGGATGLDGANGDGIATGGKGGSATAGGAGGTGTNGGSNGTNGGPYVGGAGGNTNSATYPGGGAGGGYYGGGGGGASGSGCCSAAGGGGGSGYVAPGATNVLMVAGAGDQPGNASDTDRAGAGNGGPSVNAAGQPGRVKISWGP